MVEHGPLTGTDNSTIVGFAAVHLSQSFELCLAGRCFGLRLRYHIVVSCILQIVAPFLPAEFEITQGDEPGPPALMGLGSIMQSMWRR